MTDKNNTEFKNLISWNLNESNCCFKLKKDNLKSLDKIISNNTLGSENYFIKNIYDIFIDEKKSKNTLKVIKFSWFKFFSNIFTIFLPFYINVNATYSRWINIPERNPNVFHNWSTIIITHIELIGIVYFLSQLMAQLFNLFIINNIYFYSYKSNFNCLHRKVKDFFNGIFGSLICGGFIYLLYTLIYITVEESKFFNKNYNFLSNSTNITNFSKTKLSDLDEINYIIFFTFIFSFYIFKNLKKLYIVLVYYKYEGLEFDNLTKYNPYSVRILNDSISNIGKFSLLKIISWSRHILPYKINNYFHKKKNIYNENKFTGFCLFLISIPTILFSIFLISILFSVSFLGLIQKIKQVSFVQDKEVLQWSIDNWMQFIAFLNNILSIDTGKDQSIDTSLKFIFSGDDALENDAEKESKEIFKNMLYVFSIFKQGILKTIISLQQIDSNDIQKIFIDKKENIKAERPDLINIDLNTTVEGIQKEIKKAKIQQEVKNFKENYRDFGAQLFPGAFYR